MTLMPAKPRRAAIYARISTDETRQNPETQLMQLREYATLRGFEMVGEYIDYASGRHTERASYKQLIVRFGTAVSLLQSNQGVVADICRQRTIFTKRL